MNGDGKANELPGITGPGVAPVAIAEVDALVEHYVEERNARMEYTKREVAAKTALIAALHANADKIGRGADGTIIYRHNELIVTLRSGEDKLQVRREEQSEE
jgi:hypothetical protein